MNSCIRGVFSAPIGQCWVEFRETLEKVACGKYGDRAHLGNAFAAQCAQVGIATDLVPEVAQVALHGPDALLGFLQHELVARLHTLMAGKIIDQRGAYRHYGIARAAAAVRDRPGLVSIVVNRVHSQFPEVEPAGDGVHVGAVHVHEAAHAVHEIGHGVEVSTPARLRYWGWSP